MDPNGIEQYKNVEVKFISGRAAVLTIFKDGMEHEKLTLSDYDDKDKLHELFSQKGFTKYTSSEMTERRKMTTTIKRELFLIVGACRNSLLGVFFLFLARIAFQSSFFRESRSFTRPLFVFLFQISSYYLPMHFWPSFRFPHFPAI